MKRYQNLVKINIVIELAFLFLILFKIKYYFIKMIFGVLGIVLIRRTIAYYD